MRQFHVEGFVNQYLQDADSSATKLVFTTESIENIPAGWRARETYIVHGLDEFEEVFELAEAGKPFEVYLACPTEAGQIVATQTGNRLSRMIS